MFLSRIEVALAVLSKFANFNFCALRSNKLSASLLVSSGFGVHAQHNLPYLKTF